MTLALFLLAAAWLTVAITANVAIWRGSGGRGLVAAAIVSGLAGTMILSLAFGGFQ